MPTPSTRPNPPETTRWYSPGSTISQAISLVGIALAILIIWGPTAPVSSLLPWSLDFSKIYGWIGDPWRISLSYAAIISGSLWPFWVLRHSGTPDPLGSWETKVAWPFAEGGALVFAFTQITVFLLEGQYVQAGFNSDTVFSLGVAALVMLLRSREAILQTRIRSVRDRTGGNVRSRSCDRSGHSIAGSGRVASSIEFRGTSSGRSRPAVLEFPGAIHRWRGLL